MKRILSYFVALVFILGIIAIPVSAATSLTLEVKNTSIQKDTEGVVTISCTTALHAQAFKFTGSWDTTALTYVSNEKVNVRSGVTIKVDAENGTFSYQVLNNDMTKIDLSQGLDILKITFKAKSTITGIKEDTLVNIAPVDGENVYCDLNEDGDIAKYNQILIGEIEANNGTVSIVDQHTVPSVTGLTITGDAKVGSTLTADYTFTDNYDAPDASTYVWFADGVVIEDAAEKTYEVQPADFGKVIEVEVTPTVEATDLITENLTGTHVTSDETVAVTIDPAEKVAIAKDILTDVAISGATTDLKAGKEYEVTYVNSVPAIDYTDNLELRLYLLTAADGVCDENSLVTEATENVTVTGLKFKVDKAEANKFLKVVLVANDGDATEDAFEFAPLLIKKAKSSSGSGGSTGPSLANKDKDEDVKDDDDKDVVDVDDKEDGTGTGTGLKFTDVPKEVYGWAIDAIKNLTEDGIIIGKSETAFDPSGEVTRAEFVAFLVRGLDLEEADTTEFKDVAEDFWGIKEIATAEKAGIFDYIEGDTFAPNEVLDRDEMALIAYNVTKAAGIKLPELQGSVKFDDADAINPNAVEAVDALSKAGIILGNGDGTFAPKGTTIRAAAAKVVNLILVLSK